MPASLATVPAAVKTQTERGVRTKIRTELTRPAVSFATGATIFLISYARQKRKQRLERMEHKIDRLDDKTEVLQED